MRMCVARARVCEREIESVCVSVRACVGEWGVDKDHGHAHGHGKPKKILCCLTDLVAMWKILCCSSLLFTASRSSCAPESPITALPE